MELEREVVELRAEVERQAATIHSLQSEAREQVRLRKGAEDEVDEQRGDIAEQACDQAELEAEVQRLELERDELRGSLARARSDLTLVERKFDEAERQLADKEQLARRPAMIVAQKERKNRHLQKQLEANSMLIKTIREQLVEARHSADKITSDVAEEETRERLLQRLSAAQRSQAFSEEKCWQLEEQIEDRERALEEAELEAQRLAGRLDEEEEQRLILAEELRQAKATAKVAVEEGHDSGRSSDKEERVRQLEQVAQSQDQACDSGSQHHASTKVIIRCGELEAAGKKLLLELDEKNRRMATQELALGAVQQRASELQALLDDQLASTHGTLHTKRATAPRAGSAMAAATDLGALRLQTAIWPLPQPQPHGARTNMVATAGAAVPGGSALAAAPRVWISGNGSVSGAGSVRESSVEGSGDERRRTAWRRLGNPFASNGTPLVNRRPAHDTQPSEPDVGSSIAANTGQRCWVGSGDGSSDGSHQDVGCRSSDTTAVRWVGGCSGRDGEGGQHIVMDRSRDAKVAHSAADDDRNSASSQQGARGRSSDGNAVCWVGNVDGSSGRGGGRIFSRPHRSDEEAAKVPRSDAEVAHAPSTDARQWRSSHSDAPIASSDLAGEWGARDARRESGTSDWSWDNEWDKGGDRIWSDYRYSGGWGGYPQ